MALGVPEGNIQTEAFGEQKNLTDKQVRAAVERSPGLSPEARQKALDNTRKIILASNRHAEITPGNAGQAWQNSVREFPFNAADSLSLLQEEALGKRRSRAPTERQSPKTQAVQQVELVKLSQVICRQYRVLRLRIDYWDAQEQQSRAGWPGSPYLELIRPILFRLADPACRSF